MKKLVLFAAVMVAVSFTACGGSKSEAPAVEADSTAVVAEQPACAGCDSAKCDSCVCDSCVCDSAKCDSCKCESAKCGE